MSPMPYSTKRADKATGCLVGIVAFSFSQGVWIPLIPTLLTLGASAMILPMVTAKQMETLRLQQTVRILAQATQEDPTVGNIAIDYLKQVEGQEPKRSALIEKFLNQANLDLGGYPSLPQNSGSVSS